MDKNAAKKLGDIVFTNCRQVLKFVHELGVFAHAVHIPGDRPSRQRAQGFARFAAAKLGEIGAISARPTTDSQSPKNCCAQRRRDFRDQRREALGVKASRNFPAVRPGLANSQLRRLLPVTRKPRERMCPRGSH
ncbi:hypothetical protein [Lacticaseibacillus nasuensis]|uniref:hypothetical protein n=1 Tax=Lacticaseibacillus nasuensis TaxID=944671 RepID=UPI001F2F923E|nr:hypothetical protein [Lacticaseibacillus nasuensis]